uniref:Uncharacterized protein n=1 Tax=Clastoptera arizonana TaxID=38151 RepID=A0A1B6E5N5_9HEMI
MPFHKCFYILLAGYTGYYIMASEPDVYSEDYEESSHSSQYAKSDWRAFKALYKINRNVTKDENTMKEIVRLNKEAHRVANDVYYVLIHEYAEDEDKFEGLVKIVQMEKRILVRFKEMWDRVGHNASEINEELYKGVVKNLKKIEVLRLNVSEKYDDRMAWVEKAVSDVYDMKNEFVANKLLPFHKIFYIVQNSVRHVLDMNAIEDESSVSGIP